MARRRWIADTSSGAQASLKGAQARHLAQVLRAQPGQTYEVVAEGRVWIGRIASVSSEEVVFHLEQEVAADAALPLTLLLAVFKFDRFEWAIEKVTELGVARIVPAIARRTEKHLAHAAAARVERWRRIAHEAAKQSRRSDVPVIPDPTPLPAVLALETDSVRLLLAENERTTLLGDLLPPATDAAVQLAVGPEGGWSPEEQTLFAASGWLAVSLGPRILRAETAAIAATAIVAASLLR